jgi:two-component system response regulator RegX3
MSTSSRAHDDRSAPRILVIEDDEGNREVLAYFLRRQGFAVATAASGEEGLAAVDRGAFALVLLDVVMPGMGGLDVLRALRSRFPASVLPVIMVTGLDTGDDVALAEELGADDYVTKPYQLTDALARINAVLARAAAL